MKQSYSFLDTGSNPVISTIYIFFNVIFKKVIFVSVYIEGMFWNRQECKVMWTTQEEITLVNKVKLNINANDNNFAMAA